MTTQPANLTAAQARVLMDLRSARDQGDDGYRTPEALTTNMQTCTALEKLGLVEARLLPVSLGVDRTHYGRCFRAAKIADQKP